MKARLISFVVCSASVFAAVACRPSVSGDVGQKPSATPPRDEEANPHSPDAKHPDGVAKIMKLLPQIPADADSNAIFAMLGLQTGDAGGDCSGHHCTMVWRNIAPGYSFALSFVPVFKEGKPTLVFTEAAFSAQMKSGFPPDEYHTVYPYRSSKGMIER